MKNKSLLCLVFGALLLTNAHAITPPKYLSVKNFQKCLGTKNMGTWEAWCLPKTKPDTCPQDSWSKLSRLTGKDRVPSCKFE